MLHFIKTKNVKISALGSVIIKFSTAFFSLLNGVLLARILGIENFGIYIIGFSTATILSIPASLGLPQLIVRYVSKYELNSKMGEIRGLLHYTNRIVLKSSFIIFIVACLILFFFKDYFKNNLVTTILLSLILVPVLGFSALRAATLRGFKYILLSELPDTFIRNALFTLLISIVYFTNLKILPQHAIIFQILITSISFTIGHIILQKQVLNKIKSHKKIFNKNEWLKQSIPFTINSGVQALKGRLMTFLIPIFANIEAVAIFEIALRGASLITFTLGAINNTILPHISTAYEKAEFKKLQILIRKACRITFLVALPIALIYFSFGKNLISYVFGKEYNEAYYSLIVLSLGYLFHSYTGATGPLLNMTGRQAYLTKNQVFMFLLTILIAIPLIYKFSALGAAISVSMVLTIQNIILVYYVKKELNINPLAF
jgi:O-antigen/teichoic acid export membrane protein